MSEPKVPGDPTRPSGKPATTPGGTPSIRGHWSGAFVGKRSNGAELSLLAPLKRSRQGGSAAFLGAASDGKRYWIKPLNNRQDPRVCVTEQIVGRIGELLGAPTCIVRTIEISTALAGWRFHDQATLEAGIAHASLETPNALETYSLEHRKDDANASRHAYLLALYDLCWGDDPQWLMDVADEYSFYSHDHGLYLPDGPFWTEASLARCIEAPREYGDDGAGLDLSTVTGIVTRLRALDDAALIAALAPIPTNWPVSETELELVGHFILSRAPQVAARLLVRFPKAAP